MLLRILSSLLLHKKIILSPKKYTLMIHLKERSVVFPWWSLFIPILNRSRIFLQWSYAEKLSLAFLTNTSQIVSTHTGSFRTAAIKWSGDIVTMMAAATITDRTFINVCAKGKKISYKINWRETHSHLKHSNSKLNLPWALKENGKRAREEESN